LKVTNELESDFVIDTYDADNEFLNRYYLTFNYTTKYFNEYEYLKELTKIKTTIICRKEDIDKVQREKNIITLWNTSTPTIYGNTGIYLSAFPIWYKELDKKGKPYCLKIEAVGWFDNANLEICKSNNKKIPCPDLIVLGTTQMSYRFNNGESYNLNKFFLRYLKKTGNSLENRFNKYEYYDYHINSNWLAFPLIVDLSTFRFNITTFDYCISKGYDLHYPPPLSNYWGEDYQKKWTWEKVFEYAETINKCIGKPGFRFIGGNNEDLKFFVNLCQSFGIPFLVEDPHLNIKKCGFRDDKYIQKLSIIKNFFEKHYVNINYLYTHQI